MPRSSNVTKYPLSYQAILSEMTEDPEGEIVLNFPDEKSVKKFRMSFYSYLAAERKEFMHENPLAAGAPGDVITTELDGCNLVIRNRDYQQDSLVINKAIETKRKARLVVKGEDE